MSLVVYNSLTRKEEKFEPITPGQVKMYCCGPTVYGLLHVGNFRGAIFYNFVRNWLEKIGYKVTFVYNYTDVDDKIIARSHEEKIPASEVAEKYIAEFQKDFHRLGLRKHDSNPRVTEHMDSIKNMVGTLVENKKAYVADGEVLYSIKAFDGYGKLSGRNPDELKAGARVEVDRKKHDPLDFALWKPAKAGEPAWDSAWGPGRPGWHIECSAMIQSLLGDSIDIHGGGTDLIFPHHENEIAQSEGATGKPFVKYWIHNQMLNFSGAKMSKSLGNIMTARAFMDANNPEIFKFMILSVHYRTISDFGEAAVDQAITGLARIYSALAVAESYVDGQTSVTPDPAFKKITDEAWTAITEALNHDFGTPKAFASVFEVIRTFNTQVRKGLKPNPALVAKSVAFRQFILDFGAMMALFQNPARNFLVELDDMLLKKKNLQRSAVDAIVAERSEARAQKDFAKSDELRAKLTELGISVSDTTQGSEWEVTK